MSGALAQGRRIAVTLGTALALAVTGFLIIDKPFAAEGTRLTADFGEAGQGLTESSPVKLRGVTVGRVAGIGLAPDGGARLTLAIDEEFPVPDTVTASLEPESVFGPKFVNLIPGDHEEHGPYLADGDLITRTSDSLDLNALLTDADAAVAALDAGEVTVIMDALAQGLGGSGPDLAGLLEGTATLVDVAHRHRDRARTFLADTARLARLRGVGGDVNTAVASSTALLDTLTSGEDRGLRIAQGVSGLSALLSPGLTRHEDDLRQGFRSGERATRFLAEQLPLAGDGVRMITDLLPVYNGLAWSPAPQGRRLVATEIFLPTDPCELFLGVCPEPTGGS